MQLAIPKAQFTTGTEDHDHQDEVALFLGRWREGAQGASEEVEGT